MASHRQCFYCKQSFQSSEFHNHLKQCPARQQKRPPAPNSVQYQGNNVPNNGYGPPSIPKMSGMDPNMGYGNAMNGAVSSRWTCSMCSFQNAPTTAICTMCQQGKRPPPHGMNQQRPPPPFGSGGANNYNAMNSINYNQGGSGLPPPAPPYHNGNGNNNGNDQGQQYWECPSCTFVNSKLSATCKICASQQPGASGSGSPSPSIQRSGPPRKPMYGPPNGMKPPNSYQSDPNAKRVPPPVPDSFMAAGPNDLNHGINNNNGNGNEFQFSDHGINDNNNNVSGHQHGFSEFAAMGAQEPDEATRLLIEQMMQQELCTKCKKQQGFELPCGHNLCASCARQYILMGIKSKRWSKEPLKCPSCDDGVIPLWVVKDSGLDPKYRDQLEKMQNQFMIASDPTITSCPVCHETYSTEQGDLSTEQINKTEKGLDGKLLSMQHKRHKAQFRFRCSRGGCKTVFCSGCGATPYHVGYTCSEYKSYLESKKCRFCEVSLNANNTAQTDYSLKEGLSAVCTAAECLEKRRWSCDLVHKCGHNCIGLMGHDCIECLHPDCAPKNADINDEDFCNICWVDPLQAAPCVELQCGHYFHFMCLWQKIDRKWPAARITFGFLNCPLCKQEIHHPALDDITNKYYELKKEIERDAVERVKIEGLQNDPRMKDPNSPYYNNLEKFAMDRLAFYKCCKCNKPYFGGMKACEEAGLEQAENYKQEHLVCGSCASGPNAKSCKKHGKKYITYKCKFCCSVSSWYCWGSTHFCDSCHKKQEEGDYLNRKPISELPKCPGKDKCPLGIEHPPNGTAEFSLGCVVCLRK